MPSDKTKTSLQAARLGRKEGGEPLINKLRLLLALIPLGLYYVWQCLGQKCPFAMLTTGSESDSDLNCLTNEGE